MIDIRDINDNNILNNLKINNTNSLIKIDTRLIYKSLNILIYTPSLTFGGGNQFVINIYKFYKLLGFNIKIIPGNKNIDKNKLSIHFFCIPTIIDSISLLKDCFFIVFIVIKEFIVLL
jgi:hypothetical protein